MMIMKLWLLLLGQRTNSHVGVIMSSFYGLPIPPEEGTSVSTEPSYQGRCGGANNAPLYLQPSLSVVLLRFASHSFVLT